jgi:hypothetical protein
VFAYAPQQQQPQQAAATATPSATPDGSSLPDDVPTAAGTVTPAAPEPTATPASSSPTASSAPEPTPEPTPSGDDEQPPTPPAAKHVVIVSLTGHHFSTAFGPDSTSDYLSDELPKLGTVLTRYHGVAGDASANALALMAGVTELEDDTPSLPYELGTVGKTWKAYVQGATAPCTPSPRDPFPSLPMLPDCGTSDVPLEALAADFADPDTAPSLAYVIPDRCHDGSYSACPQIDAGRDGLVRTDAWLREWIPKLLDSEAFADDGLLVVLFDGDRPDADRAKAAHVGAVIVSRFARKDAQSDRRYDHLDLLRTLADILGVDPPGGAADSDAQPLGSDVFR